MGALRSEAGTFPPDQTEKHPGAGETAVCAKGVLWHLQHPHASFDLRFEPPGTGKRAREVVERVRSGGAEKKQQKWTGRMRLLCQEVS